MGGGLLRRYTYLPGMDNPHAVFNGFVWRYFVTDGRGNVRALLNASGNTIEATYKYMPFGDTASTAGFDELNNIRFAGREFDPETGLYYNRARYYDPTLTRFVSEDAGGLSVVNRYTYAANDPVNGRDPTGRWCEWVQLEIQAAPPVAARSGAAAGDNSVLWCEDDALQWAAEQAYWSDLFADPLFLNEGRGLVDFSPIGGGAAVEGPYYRPKSGDVIVLRLRGKDFLDEQGHFKVGVRFTTDDIVHIEKMRRGLSITPWGPTTFHLKLDLDPGQILANPDVGWYHGKMLASGVFYDVMARVNTRGGAFIFVNTVVW